MIDIEPFELERWDAKWELHVATDFGQSSAPSSYWSEIVGLLSRYEERTLRRMSLGYGPSLGCNRLRAILASKHAVNPEQAIVTCGASEALFLLFGALARAGGNIVVADPCYQSHKSLPQRMGLKVRPWKFQNDLKEPPSLKELLSLIDRRTVAVVVSFPNNPTGIAVTRPWMSELIGIVEERNIKLVSDEVFLPIVYRPEFLQPGAASMSPNCVSIGDMSKAFGMGGLRVGWVVGQDPRLMNRILELRDYTSISPSVLSQFAAAVALENEPHFVEQKIRIGAKNHEYLFQNLSDMAGVSSVRRADGGFVLFPRLQIRDTRKLCERLAVQYSINVLPGSCFGYPDRVRLHFGLEEDSAESKIDSLKKALQEVLVTKAA